MAQHLQGNRIRPDNISRDQDHLRYVPTEAVTKWQILTAVASQGLHRTMAVATSATATDAARKLYLATSPARVDTGLFAANGICVEAGAIVGKAGAPIDTSAATLLDPVYLTTAGGWTLTAPILKRQIGVVLKVHATEGVIEFDGAVGAGVLSRTATITAASQTIAVGFDAALAGSPVVAMVRGTVADETAADGTLTSVVRCYWSGTSVVVAGNANATADTYVSIIVAP